MNEFAFNPLARVDRSRLLPATLFVLGFAICALPASMVSNVLAMAIYLAQIVTILVIEPSFVVRYFLVVFLLSSNMLGALLCETGLVALPELGVESGFVGSLPCLSVAHECFLAVLFLLYCKGDGHAHYAKHGARTHSVLLPIVLVGMMGLAALSLILAATHPFFVLDTDRFGYRAAGGIYLLTSRLVTALTYCTPISVMSYRAGYKRTAVLYLLMLICAAFLTGNKFGLLLSVANFVALAIELRHQKYGRRGIYLGMVILCATFVMLLGVVFLHNKIVGTSLADHPMQYLARRVSQQGQLWWRTFALERGKAGHLADLPDAVTAAARGDDPALGRYGVYKIMRYCVGNPELFARKISTGSTYAFSTQASVYYYGRLPGLLVITFVLALAYWTVTDRYARVVVGEKVLESILLARFIVMLQALLTQSQLYEMLSPRFMLYVVVYVTVRLINWRYPEMGRLPSFAQLRVHASNQPEALMIVCSPLQLLAAVCLRLDSTVCAGSSSYDLAVVSSFAKAEQVVEDLKASGLFRHVFLYNPFDKNYFPQVGDFVQYLLHPGRKRDAFERRFPHSDACYSTIFCADPNAAIDISLYASADNVSVVLFDEGAGSYIGSITSSFCVESDVVGAEKADFGIRDTVKLLVKHVAKWLDVSHAYQFRPSCLYLFNDGEWASSLYHGLTVKRIKLPEVSRLRRVSSVFDSTSFELYKSADAIFFAGWDEAMSASEQVAIAQRVSQALGSPVVFRPHPRGGAVSSVPGVVVDAAEESWELLCLSGCLRRDCILIGFASTAQIVPKLMCDLEPPLVLVAELLENEVPFKRRLQQASLQFKELYSDASKVAIPSTVDELLTVLGDMKERWKGTHRA